MYGSSGSSRGRDMGKDYESDKKKVPSSSINTIFSFFMKDTEDLLKEQRENNFAFMAGTAKYIESNGRGHKILKRNDNKDLREIKEMKELKSPMSSTSVGIGAGIKKDVKLFD